MKRSGGGESCGAGAGAGRASRAAGRRGGCLRVARGSACLEDDEQAGEEEDAAPDAHVAAESYEPVRLQGHEPADADRVALRNLRRSNTTRTKGGGGKIGSG